MGKVFPMRRRLKPQLSRPTFRPDARLIDRIAEARRERERIETERAERVAERRAAAIISRATHDAEASTNAQPQHWSDRDAAWFAAHPERNHRVRRTIEGELMPLDQHARSVAIRQIAPGVRVRLPLDGPYAQQRRLVEQGATEAGAALLFELAAAAMGAAPILAAFGKASSVQSASEDA
jgi:hypothetical protein